MSLGSSLVESQFARLRAPPHPTLRARQLQSAAQNSSASRLRASITRGRQPGTVQTGPVSEPAQALPIPVFLVDTIASPTDTRPQGPLRDDAVIEDGRTAMARSIAPGPTIMRRWDSRRKNRRVGPRPFAHPGRRRRHGPRRPGGFRRRIAGGGDPGGDTAGHPTVARTGARTRRDRATARLPGSEPPVNRAPA
jgi:hypothetical protein